MGAGAPVALVLGGGNALGAYHMGAWTVLEEQGVVPAWIAGASMGAVTAVLLAGTRPGERTAALRRFWDLAATPDGGTWSALPDAWLRPAGYASALGTRLLGRPPLFAPRAPLPGAPPGLYDTGPLRRLLAEAVDFDRVNGGATRVSLLAVDEESGEEARFDTARGRVELDHVMGSVALIPDFPPVGTGGRRLVDGGLSANTPVDLVLSEPHPDGIALFALDPFPAVAPPARDVLEAAERHADLIFSGQTRRTLRAAAREWALRARLPEGDPERRRAPGAVYRLEYRAPGRETATKGFDFSRDAIERRAAAGAADMRAALALWRARPPSGPGLVVHPPP